jgi:hypothetical protein
MIFDPDIFESFFIKADILSEIIDKNTRLLMDFEGVSGSATFRDLSPNHVVSVASGAAKVLSSVKKIGLCAGDFDGTSAYVTVGYKTDWNFSGDHFTLEFWVNTKSITGTVTIINRVHTTNWGSFKINRSGNLLVFYMSSSGSSWDIANALNLGPISIDTWHHIAITRNDSNDIVGYRNGIEKFNIASPSPIVTTTGGILLGGTAGAFFSGRIDQLRISNISRYSSNFNPIPLTIVEENAFISEVCTPYLVVGGKIQLSISETVGTSTLLLNTQAVVMEENTSCGDYVEATRHDAYTAVYTDLAELIDTGSGHLRFRDDSQQNRDITRGTTYTRPVPGGSSPIGLGYGIASPAYANYWAPTWTLATSEHPGLFYDLLDEGELYNASVSISAISSKYHFGKSDFSIEFWVRWGDGNSNTSYYQQPGINLNGQLLIGYDYGYHGTSTIEGASQYIGPGVHNRFSPLNMLFHPVDRSIYLYMSSTGSGWNLANKVKVGNLCKVNMTGSPDDTADSKLWHYFQVTRSGGTVRVFRNGALGASVSIGESTILYKPVRPTRLCVGPTFYGGSNAILYYTGVRVSKGIARVTAAYPFKSGTFNNIGNSSDIIDVEIVKSGGGGLKLFKEIEETSICTDSITSLYETEDPAPFVELSITAGTSEVQHVKDWDRLRIPFDGYHGQVSNVKTDRGTPISLFGTAQISTTKHKHGPSSLYLGSNGYARVPVVGNELLLSASAVAPYATEIDFWYYPETISQGKLEYILSLPGISTTGLLLFNLTTGNALRVTIKSDSDAARGYWDMGVNWNTWNHISIVRTYHVDFGYLFLIYLNGKRVFYSYNPYLNGFYNAPTQPLFLGAQNDSTATVNKFKGYISNVRAVVGDSTKFYDEFLWPQNIYHGYDQLYDLNPRVENSALATDTLARGGLVNKYITDNTAAASSSVTRGFTRSRVNNDNEIVTDAEAEIELNIFYGNIYEESDPSTDDISREGSIYLRSGIDDTAGSNSTSIRKVTISPPLDINEAGTDTYISRGLVYFRDKDDNSCNADDSVAGGKTRTMEVLLNTSGVSVTLIGYRTKEGIISETSGTSTELLNTHILNTVGLLTLSYDIYSSNHMSQKFINNIGYSEVTKTLSISNNLCYLISS